MKKFSFDCVKSLIEIVDIKVTDLERASMVYGFDIPIDFCLDTENISKQQLKKVLEKDKKIIKQEIKKRKASHDPKTVAN